MKAINETNFCHIEQMPDGRRVLFYVEHSGDHMVLHQVTDCVGVGTVDIKVWLPHGQMETFWPPDFAVESERVVRCLYQIEALKPAPT